MWRPWSENQNTDNSDNYNLEINISSEEEDIGEQININTNSENSTKKRRKILSEDAREIVKNVYESLKKRNVQNPVLETSELTKVPKSSVYKIINNSISKKKRDPIVIRLEMLIILKWT